MLPDYLAIGSNQDYVRIPMNPLTAYSHGMRLVAGTMTVDGTERQVSDVLRDPVLSRLLSDEGVIRSPRYPVPA